MRVSIQPAEGVHRRVAKATIEVEVVRAGRSHIYFDILDRMPRSEEERSALIAKAMSALDRAK